MGKKNEQYPIDFVITWVDGNDKEWQKERAKYAKLEEKSEIFNKWNNNKIRFRDWGTLKFLFRGIEKNANWVRNVYLVTNGQIPEWINLDNPKLKIIKHEDIIDRRYLPTFNSNAIELNLHNIKGLSEHFVYFNDDCFILKKVEPKDFFVNGKPKMTIALNCVSLEMGKGHAEVNNTKILNKYYNKRNTIKKNAKLWLNPKNGIKQYTRTILLAPWDKFPGFYDPHIESPHTKESYKKLWKLEPDELLKTVSHRFRQDSDYNHWIFKNWNACEGKVVIKKSKDGKMFIKEIDNEIINAIRKKKYKTICINDIDCSEKSFQKQRRDLTQALNEVFPQRSTYEK